MLSLALLHFLHAYVRGSFNGSPKINIKPTQKIMIRLEHFFKDWLNFQVSSFSSVDTYNAILFVVGTVIILFFLKPNELLLIIFFNID